MATYPTGIASTTNIQASDSLGNPDHATGHNNINAEINAIQTVLGTTSATASNIINIVGTTSSIAGIGNSYAANISAAVDRLYGTLEIVTAGTAVSTTVSTVVFNTTATVTMTFPSAATFAGRHINVKNANSGAVNATTSAGQFLISKTSATVTTTSLLTGSAGQWATVVSNGTNWHIIAGS